MNSVENILYHFKTLKCQTVHKSLLLNAFAPSRYDVIVNFSQRLRRASVLSQFNDLGSRTTDAIKVQPSKYIKNEYLKRQD